MDEYRLFTNDFDICYNKIRELYKSMNDGISAPNYENKKEGLRYMYKLIKFVDSSKIVDFYNELLNNVRVYVSDGYIHTNAIDGNIRLLYYKKIETKQPETKKERRRDILMTHELTLENDIYILTLLTDDIVLFESTFTLDLGLYHYINEVINKDRFVLKYHNHESIGFERHEYGWILDERMSKNRIGIISDTRKKQIMDELVKITLDRYSYINVIRDTNNISEFIYKEHRVKYNKIDKLQNCSEIVIMWDVHNYARTMKLGVHRYLFIDGITNPIKLTYDEVSVIHYHLLMNQ